MKFLHYIYNILLYRIRYTFTLTMRRRQLSAPLSSLDDGFNSASDSENAQESKGDAPPRTAWCCGSLSGTFLLSAACFCFAGSANTSEAEAAAAAEVTGESSEGSGKQAASQQPVDKVQAKIVELLVKQSSSLNVDYRHHGAAEQTAFMCAAGAGAVGVARRRVAPVAVEVGQHRVADFRINGARRRVVEVDAVVLLRQGFWASPAQPQRLGDDCCKRDG